MRATELDEYISFSLCFDLTLLRHEKCIQVAFLQSSTKSTHEKKMYCFSLSWLIFSYITVQKLSMCVCVCMLARLAQIIVDVRRDL